MKLHTHPEEFRELITVVANEKHISESAVERDYYIVMMLKSLADSPYADQCVFKGGTSLSKCYPGSIDRFSEDIDLTVYILGDLLFRNEKPAEEYLKQLKGKKHLIIGNHDRDWVKKCNLKDFFESVNNLHFISDGKRQMTLCHYPMMSWPHMTRCYMVFGHIHGNTDADYWPLIRENDLMLNAGADVNGFAPVTFEEMQENNYRHKAGWNPELCTMEADQ